MRGIQQAWLIYFCHWIVNNIGGEISVYEKMNASKFVYTRSSKGLEDIFSTFPRSC